MRRIRRCSSSSKGSSSARAGRSGGLKGPLGAVTGALFGNVQIRLRPSFFPYTEPSAEVDFSCYACRGKGCALCKYTGWIDLLGSGMVHPAVFEAVGYDPEKY